MARKVHALTISAMIVVATVPFGGTAVASSVAFAGYATGTVVHVDALRSLASRLADVEVATSAAATDAGGLTASVHNELGRLVQPVVTSARGYALGSGLELGLDVPGDAQNQVLLAGRAEVNSLAHTKILDKRIGPVALNPIAWASALQGTATASQSQCALGSDQSAGTANAADVQLLNAGGIGALGAFLGPTVALDASDPARAVVNSTSHERLVPQTDASGRVLGHNAGLMSEVRETMVPVTLFAGTPLQVTIEVLGEWVLRAVATGQPGGAWVHYGPLGDTPQTPVLRVTNLFGVSRLLSLQQLLGVRGLNLGIPGVASITIGEDARAIGGEYGSAPDIAADGTSAAAAVDVVRVKLLPMLGLADVRIGHMEARAAVPSGGVSCPIPVTKVATPDTVGVGKTFVTDIGIHNVFACPLTITSATDDISTSKRAAYTTHGISDGGGYTGTDGAGSVLWGLAERVLAGARTTRSVGFTATDGPGTIDDTVTVIGTCPLTTATGTATATVDVSGAATISVTVSKVLGRQFHRPLPTTGLNDRALRLLGISMLVGAALVARRFRRSARA